ncbi:MAG TPA: heme lyase CcmF/NrfE family subunit, partial [Micavibrio sp.]
MIPELGHFALILAFLMACVQTWAGWRGLDMLCIRAARAQFALCLGGFIALTACFVISDFTVRAVVENSHTLKPLLYKVAGVWGNHEGSMLLWILVLSFFGFLISLRKNATSVLSIQGLQGIGFLAFLLFASNPFSRLAAPPLDGNDLNPLLQDPALALHPPLLYLGYVGFSSVFSFAVAFLLDPSQKPSDWARSVRPWALLSWSSLSAGIALGSWWAYYELGWGGFWFWDPVENASLMPWLVGTALLHSIIATQTRGVFPRWTVLLAILAYSLSLLGTFLVRSGVLTSVHAFAVDPLRGLFILILLFLYIGGALLLYGLRAPALHNDENFSTLSRESALLLNNLFLMVLAATIFIGTLYPLLISALNAGQISVGPPYFHATVIPLAVPLLMLMGAGPFIAWRNGNAAYILSRLKIALALTAAIMALVWAIVVHISAGVLAGLALSAWLITTSALFLIKRRGKPFSIWGMAIAHAGLGLAVAGMIGTSLWVEEKSDLLKL